MSKKKNDYAFWLVLLGASLIFISGNPIAVLGILCVFYGLYKHDKKIAGVKV
jgi:hypothetical protein